ncbi:TPA: hypothetical protein ACX6RO_001820 [Photobacterium damselae]
MNLKIDSSLITKVIHDTADLVNLLKNPQLPTPLNVSDQANVLLQDSLLRFYEDGKTYLQSVVDELCLSNMGFEPFLDTVYLVLNDCLSNRLPERAFIGDSLINTVCLYYGLSFNRTQKTLVRSSTPLIHYLNCKSISHVSISTNIPVSTLNLWFRTKLTLFFSVARMVGEQRAVSTGNVDHIQLENYLDSISSIKMATEQIKLGKDV